MDSTANERSRLHARVSTFIDEITRGARTTDGFDSLALDIAAYQADRVPGYARLLAAASTHPRDVTSLRALPAVPTDAFRFARIAAHAPAEDAVVFRTSGTTAAARGEQALSTTSTYERAAIAWGRWALFFDEPPGLVAVVLGARQGPGADSSLGFMLDLFANRFAARARYVQSKAHDPVDGSAVRGACRDACETGAPVIVMGTSFAFVHALDALGGEGIALPPGSRAMHTGGFKGRSREVAPAALRADIASTFRLDSRAVVGEYGMTELSSQLYEGTLRASRGLEATAQHGVFIPPPWLRVVAAHPETLAPLAEGESGILRFEDLANVDGAIAVQTADVGRCAGGKVELFGRAPGAPPRGCSLAIDELLASSRAPSRS
jgi:hypothetical protein